MRSIYGRSTKNKSSSESKVSKCTSNSNSTSFTNNLVTSLRFSSRHNNQAPTTTTWIVVSARQIREAILSRAAKRSTHSHTSSSSSITGRACLAMWLRRSLPIARLSRPLITRFTLRRISSQESLALSKHPKHRFRISNLDSNTRKPASRCLRALTRVCSYRPLKWRTMMNGRQQNISKPRAGVLTNRWPKNHQTFLRMISWTRSKTQTKE